MSSPKQRLTNNDPSKSTNAPQEKWDNSIRAEITASSSTYHDGNFESVSSLHPCTKDHPQMFARKSNPYFRQNVLTKRLMINRRGPLQQSLSKRDGDNSNVGSRSTSKKRPYPYSVQSSDPGVLQPSQTVQENDLAMISTSEAWEDLSSFIPLLTYGEESNELLSALLCRIGSNRIVNVDESSTDNSSFDLVDFCDQYCTDEFVKTTRSVNNTKKAKECILSSFAFTLEGMLRARDTMRQKDHLFQRNPSRKNSEELLSQSRPPKRSKLDGTEKSFKKGTKSNHTQPFILTNKINRGILPWNVLLRLAIRLSDHVAKLISSLPQNEGNEVNNEEGKGDDTEINKSAMDQLLKVLDEIWADLYVLTRQNRHLKSQLTDRAKSSIVKDESNDHHVSDQRTRQLSTFEHSNFPQDKMIYDWKSKHGNSCSDYKALVAESTISKNIENIVWGPSRYTFMKHVGCINQMVASIAKNKEYEEWKEKINSIVVTIDDFVGGVERSAGDEHTNRNVTNLEKKMPLRHHVAKASTLSAVAKDRRNAKFSSFTADFTRVHAQRIGRMFDDGERDSNEPAKNLVKMEPDTLLSKPPATHCVESTNILQQGGTTLVGLKDYEADELDDAYRVAMSFSASESCQGARESIERRLELLIRKLVSSENQADDDSNTDGAQSYLETLLRSLISPSDPDRWVDLIKNSHDKQSLYTLRKGRSLIASFLVSIQCPGWEQCATELEPSPISSYLGYFDDTDNAMTLQSIILPPVIEGSSSHLPPPMISELGLNLCIQNFLQSGIAGDTTNQQPSGESAGITLFRNYGPLNFMAGDNEKLSKSMISPLPNLMDLTRDLFDLTLRLAAGDDSSKHQAGLSLHLATPSTLESLNVLMQIVSDHADWLLPHSVCSRYKFVLEQVFLSFQCIAIESFRDEEGGDSGGMVSKSWAERASFLIQSVKTASVKGRVALYSTQFMSIICSEHDSQVKSNKSSGRNKPHFYECLQFHQPSQFWNQVDESANNDSPSNILARVFDLSFCTSYLLPLSHLCSTILIGSHSSENELGCSTFSDQYLEPVQSIIAIICSVLNLLREDGLLRECINVGWALEYLSFSINHVAPGDDSDPIHIVHDKPNQQHGTCDSMWENLATSVRALNLSALHCDIWENEWRNFSNRQSCAQSPGASTIFSFNQIGGGDGTHAITTGPTFEVFIASLIKFASSMLPNACSSVNETKLGKYFAQILFKRYTSKINMQSPQKRDCHGTPSPQEEFALISSWILNFAKNLQELVDSDRKNMVVKTESKCKHRTKELSSREKIATVVTPLLKCLHINLMQRLSPSISFITHFQFDSPKRPSSTRDVVGFIFVDLFTQEFSNFNRSSSKTRERDSYRQCLEKIFLLTPPSTLFTRSGCQGLSESSADVLSDVWDCYGQGKLDNMAFIIFAAALHVNASATFMTPDRSIHINQDGLSLRLKQSYCMFSTKAKECITKTFNCFNPNESKHSFHKSVCGFNKLVRKVREDLLVEGAEVGATWWREITTDLSNVLNGSHQSTIQNKTGIRSIGSRDVAKAFSVLEHNLYAISQAK